MPDPALSPFLYSWFFNSPNPRKLELNANGDLATTPEHRRLPNLYVYVDESGDRNFAANRESETFSMTAVCIPAENELDLRHLMGGIRYVSKIKGTAHWKEHFRNRESELWKRAFVSRKIAEQDWLQVIHVVVDKPNIDQNAHMRGDHTTAYNYPTKLLLERVAEAAAAWPGGERVAVVRFGVVGGVEHSNTKAYLEKNAVWDQGSNGFTTPWDNVRWPVTWQHQAKFDGLQLADIYSGMLVAAIRDGDATHLTSCAYQTFRNGLQGIVGRGLKIFPDASARRLLYRHEWWRDFCINKKP